MEVSINVRVPQRSPRQVYQGHAAKGACMKKNRAPDLTDERMAIVLEALDTWKGKLS